MRTLIKILVLFYTLSFSGQNIAIELNEQEGTISTIYHTNSNIVFKISASGNLKAVFIFDSNRAANFYLRNIYLKDLLPANRLQVNDITFRIAQLKTTDYYKEFYYHRPSIKNGMVSQVNNYTLDYYNSFYVGTPSIKNGKLSKIGDIKIDYHERYNMGSPYIYNGKISKIGDLNIEYQQIATSGLPSINRGKITRIGGIKIKHFEKYEIQKDIHGKVAAIGDVRVNYEPRFYSWQRNQSSGMYRGIAGADSRVIIY